MTVSSSSGDRDASFGAASGRLASLGQKLCLAAAALGVIGLVGWFFGVAWFTVIVPGQPPMMPNTALGLLLVGIGGALRRVGATRRRRVAAIAAAGLALALGLGTLAEYVFGLDLHIDRLVFAIDFGPEPGRPSPLTAVALAFLGAAILLFDVRPSARMRPSEWLTLSAGIVAFTAVVGQVFGAGPLYRLEDAPVIGVAVPTAIGLLLTSLGLLLERPTWGVMRIATSPGPGGILLRRLTVAAVLGPVLLGLVLMGFLEVLGVEEFGLVYASLTVASTVVALFLLVVTAAPLNRIHAALESSRARTQELIDQAVDGIFVADLTGRYTDVNDAGCRMLGYAREDIIGKAIHDLVAPEQVARLSVHKQRLLAGAADTDEWTFRRSDGTCVPVEVSAKILRDGRWHAFVRDISERKRVQDQIRQSMERFELALRGADLAAWDWNITTGEVVFNRRWAEMRGYRLDEVRPHVDTWSSGIHPDDRAVVEKALNDHFRGLSPEYEAEHRVATRAGGWIWILDRGRVFARDAGGRPTRMVGTELDITTRKRIEEALRLSEAKFSGIVSLSADALVSIDERQHITLFNEGAEKIYGYSRSEAIGAPLDILIPERFRADHRRLVDRFATGPEVARPMAGRDAAIVGLRKNGEEFPAEASISRFEVGGARIVTVAVRDCSEQRRREREKERAVRVRDEVLGIVAHDLRNPLGVILLQAGKLLRRLEPGDESSRKSVGVIERAASRMNRLIQDLLDVTRMEAGRLHVQLARVSAAQIVADTLEAQGPLASAAAVELGAEVSTDLPELLADRDRLLQVFENLVGNALKFTGPGGRITVGAGRRGAREVLFRVTDTGPGIPAEDVPHLFDRFWQAREARCLGAGLGLPIVKGLVEAHGGRVWVESAPGQGSTFFFTIPAAVDGPA